MDEEGNPFDTRTLEQKEGDEKKTYGFTVLNISDQYSEMPDNMARLKNYILAIQDYYIQGMLNGEAASSLLEQQAELLNKYLTVLPEDKEMGILMVKNLVLQKKYTEAENAAEFIRYSYMIDIDLSTLYQIYFYYTSTSI